METGYDWCQGFQAALFEGDQFLWSIRLLGAEDSDEAPSENAHEMADGNFILFALGAFALVVSL